MINLVKRLELGGQGYPLVADEVRLALNGVGRGQFHVRAEAPIEAGVPLKHSMPESTSTTARATTEAQSSPATTS